MPKRVCKPRGPYSFERIRGAGRKSGTENATTAKATRSPSTADIYWAAGFIEGEGYFSFTTSKTRYGHRPGWVSSRVGACQQETEALERLVEIFGGRIRTMKAVGDKQYRSKKDMHEWNAHGARGRGVMMTIYPLMSRRRQGRIREVLAAYANYERAKAEAAA